MYSVMMGLSDTSTRSFNCHDRTRSSSLSLTCRGSHIVGSSFKIFSDRQGGSKFRNVTCKGSDGIWKFEPFGGFAGNLLRHIFDPTDVGAVGGAVAEGKLQLLPVNLGPPGYKHEDVDDVQIASFGDTGWPQVFFNPNPSPLVIPMRFEARYPTLAFHIIPPNSERHPFQRIDLNSGSNCIEYGCNMRLGI